MQKAPLFLKPLLNYRFTALKKKAWKKALDAFEAGKYREVFDDLVEYLNAKEISIKVEGGNKEFVIPHGCLFLHITVTAERYELRVPFLKSDTPSIGLMHQIAKLNMYELALSQVCYQNGQFYFYYESPLALCQPNKVYDTMKQMCTKGDYYAEQWARELDASLPQISFTYPITTALKEKAWPLFEQQLSQLEKYIEHFEQKHWESHVWVIFSVVLRYLDFALNPRGRLRREIQADISDFALDISAREKAGKAPDLLAKYRAFSLEEFLSCIYTPQLIFRDRPPADLATIHKDLNSCVEYLTKETPGDSYATIYSLLFWLRLPYYYDLPQFLRQQIIYHLGRVSDQPWNIAKKRMWTAIQAVRQMRQIPQGFWASLFNR